MFACLLGRVFRNRRCGAAPAHQATLNLCPAPGSLLHHVGTILRVPVGGKQLSHFGSLSRLHQSPDLPATVVVLRKRVVAVGRAVCKARLNLVRSDSRRRGTSWHNHPSLLLRPPPMLPHRCIVGHVDKLTCVRITTPCWHLRSADSRLCPARSGQVVTAGFPDHACVQDQGLISPRSNRRRPRGTTSRASSHLSHLSSDFVQAGKV